MESTQTAESSSQISSVVSLASCCIALPLFFKRVVHCMGSQRDLNHSEADWLLEQHEHGIDRLSAMYQLHDAPEVLPAQGLEFDDRAHVLSEKCPATQTTARRIYHRDKGDDPDMRSPRIIFGMKIQTFLIVATLMALLIVAAAVGGAVGGRNLRIKDDGARSDSSSNTQPNSSTITTTLSQPNSECSLENNTYVPPYASQAPDTNAKDAGLEFRKYCDGSKLITQSQADAIMGTFASSFDDCINLCASYNLFHGGRSCTAAVFQVNGSHFGNCWISRGDKGSAFASGSQTNVEVALLLDLD